jgi:hypothetical protein
MGRDIPQATTLTFVGYLKNSVFMSPLSTIPEQDSRITEALAISY